MKVWIKGKLSNREKEDNYMKGFLIDSMMD